MKTTELRIEGMHCDGCARTVEALLGGVPGVKKARVSFADRAARVLHDPESASAAELAAAVETGGFKAREA
jgi:copper chaperone CopZ